MFLSFAAHVFDMLLLLLFIVWRAKCIKFCSLILEQFVRNCCPIDSAILYLLLMIFFCNANRNVYVQFTDVYIV